MQQNAASIRAHIMTHNSSSGESDENSVSTRDTKSPLPYRLSGFLPLQVGVDLLLQDF